MTTETKDLALIAPLRLPHHPAIQERFGIDKSAWRALTEAVFPGAKTTDAVVLALSYCKARNLDPFKRCVHIVPVWDTNKRDYVETVWAGIAEHRITAERTGKYDGCDACNFGPDVTKTFSGETKQGKVGVTMTFPEWAQITVYKFMHGRQVKSPGPRVYWLEYYSRMGRTEVPNERWQKAPRQMIEKCAEAAALRRAFPEELGDEGVVEEAGAFRGPDEAKDTPSAPAPKRADFDASGARKEEPKSAAPIELQQAAHDMIPLVDHVGEVEAQFPTAEQWATALIAAGSERNARGKGYLVNNRDTYQELADKNAIKLDTAERILSMYQEIAAHPMATTDAGNQAGGDGSPSPSPAASIPPPLTKEGRVSAAYVKHINGEIDMANQPEHVDAVVTREEANGNLAKIGTAAGGIRMHAAKRKAALAQPEG